MIDMVAEKKCPKEYYGLPLTPMIDVVFLLNIFFVSVQFNRLAGELEARLPRTPGVVNRIQPEEELIDQHIWVRVEAPSSWKSMLVTDAKTGKQVVSTEAQPVMISVNGRPVNDYDALQWELASKKFLLEADGKKPLVVLELDPRLTFQNVVSAVNAAKKAKFADISFTPPSGVPRE